MLFIRALQGLSEGSVGENTTHLLDRNLLLGHNFLNSSSEFPNYYLVQAEFGFDRSEAIDPIIHRALVSAAAAH